MTVLAERRADEPVAKLAAALESYALVERARAGDMDAFGEIFTRCQPVVFRYVYFRVGSRQLAEDLTQEAFLRALRRIGKFEWRGKDVAAWIVTIARNLIADHFKSGRYRLEVATGDVLDADSPCLGWEGSPEQTVVDHLTHVGLMEALKLLSEMQRQCLVLRFLRGLSVAETARAMGANEGSVKALQFRAVRSLNRFARQLGVLDSIPDLDGGGIACG